ncbi:MAG: glycosyltransferase family 4 protein [Thermoanaerobaculia bacterium]|nr:glycosyltransferase family 4 protein [Thermoanaerobaculia bacterium]
MAYVNLAFLPLKSARELLERQATMRLFCEAVTNEPGITISLLSRFGSDEDLEFANVRATFRSDWSGSPWPRFWHQPAGLLRVLRDLEPDIIHVNGFVFPVQTADIKRAAKPGAALLLQHHGETVPEGAQKLRQAVGTRLSDGVLFTATEMARPWIEAGMFRQDVRVYQVLEASTLFSPRPRESARAATRLGGDPALLWVGRLHPRKDPETALRGFEAAASSLPGARLHMVFQEDVLLSQLEALITRSPVLRGRVEMIGRVEHEKLPDYYSAADLFVTSSPSEGSNYALIEALACGLFPVGSDIPAHRAITSNGDLACLFTPGDPVSCGEAISRALGRLRGEATLRSRVRVHFEENLSWSSIGRSAAAAYRSASARELAAAR